jgi:hypothetical protein
VGVRHASQTIFSFLNLVRQHSPEQFRTRDVSDSLPLHIAVQLPFDPARAIIVLEYPEAVIEFLLYEYPEAAGIADGQGRLPLHIAMEHGLPCADLLLDAEPRALETRCMVTHMYPFQLAALAWEDSEHEMHSVPTQSNKQIEEINTMYTLLRKMPHLLSHYVVANDSASAGNASQVVDANDRASSTERPTNRLEGNLKL